MKNLGFRKKLGENLSDEGSDSGKDPGPII